MTNKATGVEQYMKMLEWADGSGSDLFAMANAYRTWHTKKRDAVFGTTETFEDIKAMNAAEDAWASANHLDLNSLYECNAIVDDLTARMKRVGLNVYDTDNWSKMEKFIVLKAVIAGAFYPNYYSRSSKNKRQCETATAKELTERDPCDTVYFTGFNKDDCRHIYIARIKEFFVQHKIVERNELHKIKVTFDGVGQKVFVTFKKSGKENDKKTYGVACQPGFVLTEVYKSVKMRQISPKHEFPIIG